MSDSNNNNESIYCDQNNNETFNLDLNKKIGSIQDLFNGLKRERDEYKKKSECTQLFVQKRNDENYVLHKSMDHLLLVCREGKMAIDRITAERNKFRKLVSQQKGTQKILSNLSIDDDHQFGIDFNDNEMVSVAMPTPLPKLVTKTSKSERVSSPSTLTKGAVPKRIEVQYIFSNTSPQSQVITLPKPINIASIKVENIYTTVSPKTPKRKSDAASILSSSSKKRKIYLEKQVSEGKTKRNRKLVYEL